MNDAAEALDAIYQQIQLAARQQGLPAGVDELFGLWVKEAVDCSRCGKTTHQSSYTKFLYSAQVRAGCQGHYCMWSDHPTPMN
jgi:hypothetical protein